MSEQPESNNGTQAGFSAPFAPKTIRRHRAGPDADAQ